MGNSLKKLSGNRENPQLEKEKGEEDINGDFTCEICIEAMSANTKFKNKNHCAHPFCLDCITKYIEVNIEDHTARIPCPGLNCVQILDPFSCRVMIPPSVFTKWCDVLCDTYVLEFERIYCPNRNCGELVVNECGGTVKKSNCPNCKTLFCFQCKLAWHAGYGCEESSNMRDHNDILFGQLVERKEWNKCPGCGCYIEHQEGCSVVTCRCKTLFCYKCGEKVSVCNCSYRRLQVHDCNCRRVAIIGLGIVGLMFYYVCVVIVFF